MGALRGVAGADAVRAWPERGLLRRRRSRPKVAIERSQLVTDRLCSERLVTWRDLRTPGLEPIRLLDKRRSQSRLGSARLHLHGGQRHYGRFARLVQRDAQILADVFGMEFQKGGYSIRRQLPDRLGAQQGGRRLGVRAASRTLARYADPKVVLRASSGHVSYEVKSELSGQDATDGTLRKFLLGNRQGATYEQLLALNHATELILERLPCRKKVRCRWRSAPLILASHPPLRWRCQLRPMKLSKDVCRKCTLLALDVLDQRCFTPLLHGIQQRELIHRQLLRHRRYTAPALWYERAGIRRAASGPRQ